MRIKASNGPNASIHLGPAQWLAEAALPHDGQTAAGPSDTIDSTERTQNGVRALIKGGFRIECLNWEQASHRYDDWRALAGKALETNVLNEPEFALSAAQHFPPAGRPVFLFVSQSMQGDAAGPLAAVFALRQPRRSGNFIGHLWCPPEMAMATPLVHRDHGLVALDLLQEWLAREFPFMSAFMMPMIPAAGPFAQLMTTYSQSRELMNCQFDLRSRAVLHNAPDTADRVLRWMGRKRHKEMWRLWRRLSECGNLEFMTARTGPEIKSATEYFMALEAMGWKGEKHSALLCDPSLATFTRTCPGASLRTTISKLMHSPSTVRQSPWRLSCDQAAKPISGRRVIKKLSPNIRRACCWR
jgi:hypothetical protein